MRPVRLEIRMWSAKAQLLPAATAPPWPPVVAPAPPTLRKSGAFALHMDRRVSFWTRISNRTGRKNATGAVVNPDVECKSVAFAGGPGSAVAVRAGAGSAGATQKRRFCTPHGSQGEFLDPDFNRTGRKNVPRDAGLRPRRGRDRPPAIFFHPGRGFFLLLRLFFAYNDESMSRCTSRVTLWFLPAHVKGMVMGSTSIHWFEEVYKRHHPKVYAVMYARLSCCVDRARVQQAEEKTQDVFMALWKWVEPQPSGGAAMGCDDVALGGILFKIARRIAINHWAKRHRHLGSRHFTDHTSSFEDLLIMPQSHGLDPEQRLRLKERLALVTTCLRALSDRQRVALVLQHALDLDIESIALLLGENRRTVQHSVLPLAQRKFAAELGRRLGVRDGDCAIWLDFFMAYRERPAAECLLEPALRPYAGARPAPAYGRLPVVEHMALCRRCWVAAAALIAQSGNASDPGHAVVLKVVLQDIRGCLEALDETHRAALVFRHVLDVDGDSLAFLSGDRQAVLSDSYRKFEARLVARWGAGTLGPGDAHRWLNYYVACKVPAEGPCPSTQALARYLKQPPVGMNKQRVVEHITLCALCWAAVMTL